MKTLALDPGYGRLGVAVLEKPEAGNEVLLYSACLETSKTLPLSQRIDELASEIDRLIEQHTPEELAIETLFFNTNQKTAMAVAEARGVLIHRGRRGGLAIFEYSPPEVKTAITGDGRADKKQMMALLPKVIRIEKTIQFDDEYDAIAVGLAHSALRARNLRT